QRIAVHRRSLLDESVRIGDEFDMHGILLLGPMRPALMSVEVGDNSLSRRGGRSMAEETENKGGREADGQDEAQGGCQVLDELCSKPAIRGSGAVGRMGKECHCDLHISL
ncbi:hypothetical protein AB4144_10565, partial [Rhizobiaceae sp. 2RAB30]